ncbi:MAG TPA: hypothetical protein VHE81_23440, partial [Lacipirellulaceae bacterium]|nr:hypothetical protein [Lacipirellulaceae bacterium]
MNRLVGWARETPFVRHIALSICAVLISLIASVGASAQRARDASLPLNHYTDGVVGQFDELAGNLMVEPASVSAKFTSASADRPAILFITAKIARGRHAYSLTQPPGGPQPTTIKLDPSSDYRLLGQFRSQPAPTPRVEDLGGGMSIKVEEHEGQVTWYAPIELTAGVDAKSLAIRGTIHMQVCETHGTCESVTKKFVGKETTSVDPAISVPPLAKIAQSGIGNLPSTTGAYQPPNSDLKLSGRIAPGVVKPGESATIEITATPPEHWHIYAHADRDTGIGSKPTLIAIETSSGLLPHRAATKIPIKVEPATQYFPEQRYHDSPVTWKLRLDVPKSAAAGNYPIAGLFGYQICETGSSCERPNAARFSGTLKVSDTTSQSSAPLIFSSGVDYQQVAK